MQRARHVLAPSGLCLGLLLTGPADAALAAAALTAPLAAPLAITPASTTSAPATSPSITSAPKSSAPASSAPASPRNTPAPVPSDIPLTTPALPPAPPSPLTPRAYGDPTYLYVNFDGAVLRGGCGNDAHRDCSTLATLFDGYVGPFDGNLIQRVSILQSALKDVADFGIRVVTRRPAEDAEYTMILYGDLGPQDFAGIAPYIDCGDLWPSDTAFANSYGNSNLGSTIILQEAAHTWGLEHVDAPFDNMHPFKTVSEQSFTDECHPIVASTDLDPIGGVCNQIHELFCETGSQNSWQELRYLFGPAVPDLVGPSLEITEPEDGATFVLPTEFHLRGTVDDDLWPQIYAITLAQGDEVLVERSQAQVDFLLTNPPAGDYDMLVRITDLAGHVAEDRVRFTVLPEGSPLPDDDADADADGCRVAARAPAHALLLPLLLLARRRRRARSGPSAALAPSRRPR